MAALPPPILLPPQINDRVVIPRPAMPANPPTAADHRRAADYVQDVQTAKDVGGATDTQLGEAYRYLALIDAALYLPALQLPTVQQSLQVTMQATLQDILPAALQNSLAELYIMAAQTHNRQVIDGLAIPFREVRYPNGDRPTQNPHNLPLLYSTNAINALVARDLVAYINGYTPNAVVPPNRDARMRLIKLAIGCPV